jgi:hypothetical protein
MSEQGPSPLPPEPGVGTLLLASDGRVWVRVRDHWNSNQGWFGWDWESVVRVYGGDGLRFLNAGLTLTPTTEGPLGGPWTSHGHDVAGVTVAGAGRPPRARCGGPGLCIPCSQEATRLTAANARSTALGDDA